LQAEKVDVHVSIVVFSNSLFRRLIVQPRTPKADREDICPHKKQTIHNALRDPKTPDNSSLIIHLDDPEPKQTRHPVKTETKATYFVDEEYFVTALVPSETACLASSPGRMSRTLETGQYASNV